VTHFRTSATALETDASQLRAAQLVSRPGTLPTVTIPMAAGRLPDVDELWRHLAEPAEFFGLAMPRPAELARVLSGVRHRSPVATTVTIVEDDGATRFAASAVTVAPWQPDAVRLAGDAVPQAHRAADPWWRRMAARTTSKGELDQRARWLAAHGYADAVSEGQPVLGALVFQTTHGLLAVENPEPTSVLDQLMRSGAITALDFAPACPAVFERVWWVSPHYQTHPVAELDGTRCHADSETVPSFARWT
jgi:hypothetical protein